MSIAISRSHRAGPVVVAKLATGLRRAALTLNVASSQVRLAILLTLEEQERDTTQLCSELGDVCMASISRELTTLREGRLVHCKRRGKHRIHDLTEAGFGLVRFVRWLGETPESQGDLPEFPEHRIVSHHDDREPEPHIAEPCHEPL